MHKVTIRLQDSQYTHLKTQSTIAGLKMEPFIRSLIMGSDLKPRPPDEWPELVRQVSGIGRNINQIARQANADKRIDPAMLEEVMRMQAAIWQLVKNL